MQEAKRQKRGKTREKLKAIGLAAETSPRILQPSEKLIILADHVCYYKAQEQTDIT
jgi:hypothetical protein